MEQETYLERIKKLKSTRKITNEKLSEMTGIPLGTLSKLLAGISDSPKLANIVAIAQALGCSLDYLMTGEPENTNNYTLEPAEITLVETFRILDGYGQAMVVTVMEKERDRAARQAAEEALLIRDLSRRQTRGRGRTRAPEEVAAEVAEHSEAYRYRPELVISPSAEAVNTPEAIETPIAAAASSTPARPSATSGERVIRGGLPAGLGRRRIPLYDLPVSAGVGEFLSDSTGTEIFIPDAPRTKEADYALRISGDSMEPKYHSGDVLLIENCESVEEGELGIFVLDGSGYFKKYGGDRLISLNHAYAPIMLKDFEQIVCCGRVVGKLKRK